MGIAEECFVHPPPRSLICPICLGVLEDPVACPSGHLFCRQELAEWFRRGGGTCPADNVPIHPSSVTELLESTTGRVVQNLLGELERYCPKKEKGCTWTGQQDCLEAHLRDAHITQKPAQPPQRCQLPPRCQALPVGFSFDMLHPGGGAPGGAATQPQAAAAAYSAYSAYSEEEEEEEEEEE
ncbi:unnamed protein product, partial [Chrysoparadoxa australica]